MDTSEMRDLLRGYLNELDWSNGATKDEIMGKLTERDDDLRTMVDEYIAEGTYPSVDEVLFLIPDQAWQSAQGDAWRGPEIQYVENVETGFKQSPVGQDENPPQSGHRQQASAGRGMPSASSSGSQTSQPGSGGSGQQTSQHGGPAQAGTSGRAPRGGMPGDGAGRVENPGTQHAGVWPVSGPMPEDEDLSMQGMASFGQGERGAAGYEDSGRSEAFTVPPEGGSGAGNQTTGGSGGHTRQRVGAPGSNAGEVDPAIGGSGETTGKQPADTGGAGFGNASGGGGQGDAADTADRPSH